jgi:hypothetical protein
MLKKYVGKNRAENLDWLLNRWLKEGPPVCFLQGFPGVGKTDLAHDFRNAAEKLPGWQRAIFDDVPDRATPSVMDSLLDVGDKLSRQGLPEMENVLLGETTPNPAYALEQVLKRNVVIVLDEAQRFFRPDSGTPLPEMIRILDYLRYRQNLPGRLLLLSDRVVERARWSEWIPIRELKKLEPAEALEAFDDKLKFAGITEEIPDGEKQEALQALDCNPRAIESLVASLAYDSLKEIMGRNRGLWDVRDRDISREFLNKLELDLLEHTLAHQDPLVHQRLLRLSVHRKSFEKAALELVCGGTRKEWREFGDILLTRFLLNRHSGWHSLNPIVREIALAKLKDQPAECLQAHERAADYHWRHFKARDITAGPSKLGASFAELRYHLTQSGRQADLREVALRFTDLLKRDIQSVSPVPVDPEELDERIAVLSALLETQGADSLEYHLARCLNDRNRPGDWKRALIHLKRITRVGAPAVNWFLRAELEATVEGLDAALRTIYEAIHKLQPDSGVVEIYGLGANLLAQVGKIEGEGGAVALLKEGIKIIPPDKGLFSLYQMLGHIRCRAGHVQEAITSLREGLSRIPSQLNGYKLVEAALFLCAASDATQTLAEILSGKEASAIDPEAAALGTVLQCQMRGDWKAAADTASTARKQFPRYFVLASLEAFSRLALGEADAAWQALASFPNLLFKGSESRGWLASFIHLRRRAHPEASAALTTYLGRPVDEGRELNEAFLLRLWDQQEIAPENYQLSFYFPIMPASLTGLSHAVRRVPFAKPVLPAPAPGEPANLDPAAPTTTASPEIYVSYAWGEDSSPAGREREEIVNRLCETVRRTGRVIGRDKERMRGGDSIERFAQEISKARRIVAVISEKSLNSEFCMAQELFRAFRRCDYQRAEFQEKVIAVVMDDAKPLLRDNLALVTLAQAWQERTEKLRAKFQAVDPTRKSPALWLFVDLMEEMCPRLPDMLGALQDIVMRRGFEEITRDGFQEVLNRLPPRPETGKAP